MMTLPEIRLFIAYISGAHLGCRVAQLTNVARNSTRGMLQRILSAGVRLPVHTRSA